MSEENPSIENARDENEHSPQDVGEHSFGLRTDGSFKNIVHEVIFGPGASVLSIKLQSDFSSLQVLRLPNEATSSTIANFFEALGFIIPESEITLNIVEEECVATIKFVERTTAKRILEKVDAIIASGNEGEFEFTVKLIPPKARFGNWIQFNTARVSWFKTSRKAFLEYRDERDMNRVKQTLEKKTTPAGRAPRGKVQQIGRMHRLRNKFTLEVTNLEEDITEEWLLKVSLHEAHTPPKIKIVKPLYSLGDDHCEGLVQTLLRSIGPLEFFDIYNEPRSPLHQATVGFLRAHHAAQAVATLNNNSHDGIGKLYVELISQVKFNIPYKIAKSLKGRLSKVSERIVPDGKLKVSMSSWKDIEKPYVTMRLTGRGPDAPKNIAAARSALEHVLAGTVILYKDKALWHSYFTRPEALTFLVELSAITGVYIYRDLARSQLVLYGGQHYQRKLFAEALSRKFLEVKKAENDELNILSNILLQVGSGECVVCTTADLKSFTTPCGHTYCLDCFEGQVAAADKDTLPLRCVGAEDTCRRAFSMKELINILPFKKLEKLLASSLRIYIDTHHEEYIYCPTLGCTAVYRVVPTPNDNDNILFCSKCLSSICITCWTPRHADISCETNKRNIAETADAVAFEEFKAENDVKDCPKCCASIQKREGCNHMTCTCCGAHMCWVCSEVFENADACYAHLTARHGGYR